MALDADDTAQVVISLLVGANRTRVLTPYAPPALYEETLAFVSRSLRNTRPHGGVRHETAPP